MATDISQHVRHLGRHLKVVENVFAASNKNIVKNRKIYSFLFQTLI